MTRGARRSAEKLSFFGVRCIASEAYSYGARQFSKSNFILSYLLKITAGDLKSPAVFQFIKKKTNRKCD
jgi:hypothetical protein